MVSPFAQAQIYSPHVEHGINLNTSCIDNLNDICIYIHNSIVLHKPLFIQLNLKVLNVLNGGTLSLCVFPPTKFGFTVLVPRHLVIFIFLHLQTMLPGASLPRLLSLVCDYSSGKFPDTGLSGSGDTFIFRFEHPTSLPFRKNEPICLSAHAAEGTLSAILLPTFIFINF